MMYIIWYLWDIAVSPALLVLGTMRLLFLCNERQDRNARETCKFFRHPHLRRSAGVVTHARCTPLGRACYSVHCEHVGLNYVLMFPFVWFRLVFFFLEIFVSDRG